MIPAIVLAAGASSRMGRPKALLPTGRGDETFLGRIVTTLSRAPVDDLIVVVGHDADDVVGALESLSLGLPGLAHGRSGVADAAVGPTPAVRIVENHTPAAGQLSSLQAGLLAADRPGTQGVLVALVDVPFFSAGTASLVLARARAEPDAVVVRPVDADDTSRHGHPVVFHRRLFPALLSADPAQGAKPVVRAQAHATRDVPVRDPGAFEDIDTPEDYARWMGFSLP